MGYVEFSNFAEMDQSECKRVIHLYTREAYPSIPLWWDSVGRQLKKDRSLVNCFGRKVVLYDPPGHDLLKKGVAFIPQSTVVDLVNNGMISIYYDDDLNKRWDILAQVHDSVTSQVIVENWIDAARDCSKVAFDYMNDLCHYNGRDFNIFTDMKIGPTWGEHGMKKVKLTKDIDKLAKDMKTAWEQICADQKIAA